MAELEVKPKRGRPKKSDAPKPEVAPEPTPVAEAPVVEETKGLLGRAKDAVMAAVPTFDAATSEQLKTFGKGVAVAAADAALVYVKDNVGTLNFGKFDAFAKTLLVVGVGELRNLLHGGPVSTDVFFEAVETELSKAKAAKSEGVVDEEEVPEEENEEDSDEEKKEE